MHYKNGRPVELGDFVIGVSHNSGQQIVFGVVLQIMPQQGPCNIRIARLELSTRKLAETAEKSFLPLHNSDGWAIITGSFDDYGDAAKFLKCEQSAMTTPAISPASTDQAPSVGIGSDALVLPPILCDCKGREILLGDTLKVFHFTGARRKKYWMYKHVVERVMLGTANPQPAYKLSHLNLRPESYYWELIDGRHLEWVEIVQGYGADGTPFDDRPRHTHQFPR